jgi:hypothetical protein
MRLITIIVIVLSLGHTSFAQKHDFFWTFGYAANYIDTIVENGGCTMDFNSNPPKMTKLNTILNFQNYGATCSDSSGQLQFYTNGMRIYNKNYQLMENGDTINPGDRWESFNEDNIGYIGTSPIIVPAPKGGNSYYMIHLGIYINGTVQFGPLYYTEIDMNANNGNGKVVSKNTILMGDSQKSFSSPVAIKHANGRDWWLLIHIARQSKIIRYLINPEGIIYSGEQEVNFDFTFENGRVARCQASPNGMQYALLDSGNFLALFDFDRCTGLLSNKRTLHRQSPVLFYGYLTFSPDSRLLYLSNLITMTQLDLMADTLQPNILDTVQTFDYTNYPSPPFYAGFGEPIITPNGKIYYIAIGATAYMNVLHRPNLPGSACDYETGGLRLPRFNARTYFLFPNYRLGALTDSPCDTLGFKQPPNDGFVNTSYETFLEQQARSKRQVFRQMPPYTGKKDVPFNPESPEAIIEAEMKQNALNKAKKLKNEEK